MWSGIDELHQKIFHLFNGRFTRPIIGCEFAVRCELEAKLSSGVDTLSQICLSANSLCGAAKLETFLILLPRTANLHPIIGRVNRPLHSIWSLCSCFNTSTVRLLSGNLLHLIETFNSQLQHGHLGHIKYSEADWREAIQIPEPDDRASLTAFFSAGTKFCCHNFHNSDPSSLLLRIQF